MTSPGSQGMYGDNYGGHYGHTAYSGGRYQTWSWQDLCPWQHNDSFFKEPYNRHCHPTSQVPHQEPGFFRGTLEKLGIVSDDDTKAATEYVDLVGEMDMVLTMQRDGVLRKDSARRQADIIMEKMLRIQVNRPDLVDQKLEMRGISLHRRAQMTQEYRQLRRGPLGVASCCL